MISNYAELQGAVNEWVNHSSANARVTDFIALAEAEISADLSVDPMKLEQSVAFAAGADSIDLPDNLINPESFRISTARNPDVLMVTREMLSEFSLNTRAYDSQRVYGALVGRALRLFPEQTSSGTVDAYGKCAIPALSDSSPVNWLLTAFPNVYLFAAIREAGAFLRDQNMVAWAEARYQSALSKVSTQYAYVGRTGAAMPRSVR